MSQPDLLEEFFNCPPAYNVVLACLSPPEVIRLGKTCRLLRDAVASFHRLAYNVNRHLDRFVSDPIALRRLQVEYKFLISGSNALQFLDRSFYPSSDLDIFAYPENVKELGWHLINNEEYVFEPSPKQPAKYDEVVVKSRSPASQHHAAFVTESLYNHHMSDLLRFKNKKRDLEIQLISCRCSPLDCILYFHSTPVMNFMTADMAYSLYPKATFDKRIGLQLASEAHERTGKAFAKYTERGWDFIVELTWEKVKEISPLVVPDTVRYLDDEYTWRVPLDTEGLDIDSNASRTIDKKGKARATAEDEARDFTAGNPFHCNSWTLDRDFNGYSSVVSLGMGYEIYNSTSMEDTYVFAERGLCEAADELVDYLEEYNPALKGGKKYLDSFLPRLREAHKKVPKRVYSM